MQRSQRTGYYNTDVAQYTADFGSSITPHLPNIPGPAQRRHSSDCARAEAWSAGQALQGIVPTAGHRSDVSTSGVGVG